MMPLTQMRYVHPRRVCDVCRRKDPKEIEEEVKLRVQQRQQLAAMLQIPLSIPGELPSPQDNRMGANAANGEGNSSGENEDFVFVQGEGGSGAGGRAQAGKGGSWELLSSGKEILKGMGFYMGKSSPKKPPVEEVQVLGNWCTYSNMR